MQEPEMDESCSDSVTIIALLSIALAHIRFFVIGRKILFHPTKSTFNVHCLLYFRCIHNCKAYSIFLFVLPLETSHEHHEKRRYIFTMYYTLVIVFDTRFKNRISIRRLFCDFYHGLESPFAQKQFAPLLPLLTKMLMLNWKFYFLKLTCSSNSK